MSHYPQPSARISIGRKLEQLLGGGAIAAMREAPKLVKIAPLRRHVDQLVDGRRVARVGEAAQLVPVAALPGELDELIGRVRVAEIGLAPKLAQTCVVQQPTSSSAAVRGRPWSHAVDGSPNGRP